MLEQLDCLLRVPSALRIPSIISKRCVNSRDPYGASLTVGEITIKNLKSKNDNQLSFGKLFTREKETENRINIQ